MTYGTSAYGSTAIGGSVASLWFIFFPLAQRDADVLFESRLEYSGEGLFSVFTRQTSEASSGTSDVIYKIYTSNDPGETPQLQATQEGNGQTVVGAARFIVVTAYVNPATWTVMIFEVRGRAGD